MLRGCLLLLVQTYIYIRLHLRFFFGPCTFFTLFLPLFTAQCFVLCCPFYDTSTHSHWCASVSYYAIEFVLPNIKRYSGFLQKKHQGAAFDFCYSLNFAKKSNHCQYISENTFDNNDQLQLCFVATTIKHTDYSCTPSLKQFTFCIANHTFTYFINFIIPKTLKHLHCKMV